MKIKYLILVDKARKQVITKKTSEIEKKLTDHNHDKYINTSEFNSFTAEVFDARLTWANLVSKTDFDTKMISLNKKSNSDKTKHLLAEN